MHLSKEAVEEFQCQGYLKIDHQLIENDHLEILRRQYDQVFAKHRNTDGQGLRNLAVTEGTELQRQTEMLQIMEMWQKDEQFYKLLFHQSLLDITESLIGKNIQLFHDQALYKPAHIGGEVPWHQDNGYWRCSPPNLVSIWIALDDADEDNGCMNVIPKSYTEGGLDHTRAKSEEKELPALLMANIDDSQAVPVPLLAGHGMVHHCLTLHQTNPNNSSRDRRAIVIHYMPVGTQNSKGEILADNLLLRGVNHFNAE